MDGLIRLNSTAVNYLDAEVLENYSNLVLVSANGEKVRMNLLTFAALRPTLLRSVILDNEEHTFITEFSQDELNSLVNLCMNGVLPSSMTSFESDIPESIEKVFSAFGIDLFGLLLKKPKIECEVVVKEEDSDDIKCFDHFLHNDEHSKSYNMRKKHTHSSDDEDTPTKNAKKREYGLKYEREDDEEENELYSCDIEEEGYRVADDREWAGKKSRVVMKARGSLVESYTKAAKELAHVIKVQIPCQNKFDHQLLEDYKLPHELSYFLKGPRTLVNSELIDELNRDKPLACQLCPRRFETEQNQRIHWLTFHSNHYDCTYCHRTYGLDDVETFRKHMFRHEHITQTTRAHECIQCGYSSLRISVMRKHAQVGGPFHTKQCTQCSETFNSYDEHKSHVSLVHQGLWKYKCGICEELFDAIADTKRHRKSVHNEKSSGKSSATIKSEGEGAKQKLARKVCDICGKAVYGLTMHKRLRHEKMPNENLPCPFCGNLFRSAAALTAHKTNVHEKVPCSICGEMVAPKSAKRHYSQRHTPDSEKKFKCKFCGKGFVETSRLRDHVNTHTGEKPYVCKFCGAAFASCGTYRMHERGHLGHKRSKK